jgi:TRAP-type C4-dicarboxylate transport system substrate-binding protein
MKKEITYRLVVSILVFLFIAVIGLEVSPSQAADKKWTLKAQTVTGPKARVSTLEGAWALLDKIEEETKGRVKFKRFVKSQLAKPKEVPSALEKGLIDWHFTGGLALYTGVAPEIGFNMVPGTITDWETAEKVVRNPEMLEILEKAWNTCNGHWVAYVPGSEQAYLLNKPIKSFDDLSRLRLGSSGGMFDKFIQQCSATAVTVPPAERYTALQRGLIDGITGPIYALGDYKWGEVTKQVVLPPLVYPNVYGHVMRKDLWDEFPDDIKAAIQRAVQWHWGHTKQFIIEEMEKKKNPGILKKYKMEVFSLSDSDRAKFDKTASEVQEIFGQQSPECRRILEIYKTQIKGK